MKTSIYIEDTKIVVINSKLKNIVHVYKDRNLEIIVQAPDEVLDICLTRSSDTPELWALYLVTKFDLYRVTESHVKDIQEKASHEQREKPVNHEIFSDLFASESDDDPVFIKCSDSTEPVLVLEKSHQVHTSHNPIIGICVACSYVFMACEENELCVIYLYSEIEIIQNRREANIICIYHVPGISSTQMENSYAMFKLFVITCELIQIKNQKSSNTLEISSDLIKCLFEQDSILLNSPILLACTPEGSAFYSPIKSTDSAQSPRIGLDLKLLCPTSQPIVNLVTIDVDIKTDSPENYNSDTDIIPEKESLPLLVCRDGKCLGIILDKDNGAQFVSMVIPGPIIDFAVQENRIYSSIGNDLFYSTISIRIEANEEIKMEASKPVTLQYANISIITCLRNPGDLTGNECILLCKTTNGDIKFIDPEKRSRSPSAPQSQSNAGQRIKDLLVSIENCNIRRQSLKALQQKQRLFLSQLNIAAYLKFICESQVENREPITECRLRVTTPESGLIRDTVLCCHLTNRSQVTLSCDWKVMVKIQQTGNEDVNSLGTSTCAKLMNDFKADENLLIKCRLPSENILIPYHVTVYLCLQFPEELAADANIDPVVTVLIHTRTVDILHFMYEEKYFKACNRHKLPDSREIIQELATCRSVAESLMTESVVANPVKQEQCSIVLNIEYPCRHSQQESIMGKENADLSILQYILRSCPETITLTSSSVSLVNFVGHEIHLSAEKVKGNGTADGKGINNFKIYISTNTTSLAAAVRQSILQSLQALKLDHSGQWVQRKVLQMKENNQPIQEHLRVLQNQTDMDMADKSGEPQDVLKVYRHLRDLPI